jgi:predicted O-methyltransferase YrrM
MDIVGEIREYERMRGAHYAGTVSAAVLRRIIELAPQPLSYSVETGSGRTTILLCNLAKRHLCFTLDDRYLKQTGTVPFVQECPIFWSTNTTFVFGPTQRTLPKHSFDHLIDLALIDGAHAYPFPELDYYFLYPHLRPGALLIVDDIHIPTIRHMAEFLSEDEMFVRLRVEGTTAFFERTTAATFDPEDDGWMQQRFNINRFRERSAFRLRMRKLAQTLAPSLMAMYSRMRLRDPR